MQGDNLAILLFWLSLAIGAGYEAVSATGARRIFFAALAAIFLLTGVFWQSLKGVWPQFSNWVTAVATSPETWFVLFMFGVAIVIFGMPRRKAVQCINLEKTRAEISAEIDDTIISAMRANNSSLIDGIRNLGSKIDEVSKNSASKLQDFEQFKSDARADLARLNEAGVTQHGATEYVRGQVAALQKEIKDSSKRTYLLIKAVRAHDAERDVLIPNDETVMSLGKQLTEAKATDYPDPVAWLSDYQRWHAAIRAIDRVVLAWTDAEGFGGYASLLDLQARHFQHSPMPPDNIRTDDTIIPYKTVWHAQSSYANQRDNIFAFFRDCAAYPN